MSSCNMALNQRRNLPREVGSSSRPLHQEADDQLPPLMPSVCSYRRQVDPRDSTGSQAVTPLFFGGMGMDTQHMQVRPSGCNRGGSNRVSGQEERCKRRVAI